MQGRVALGPRAGARVLQIGREPNAPWVTSRGPCQAHLEGFDLHANLAVRADDRQGLERLCRYVLRPPVARDRLELTADGRVLVILKGEWSDGTTHLLFEPVELLEKLAALTPRPRINPSSTMASWPPMPAGGGGSSRTPGRRPALQHRRTPLLRTASRGPPILLPKRESGRAASPRTPPSGLGRTATASLAAGPGRTSCGAPSTSMCSPVPAVAAGCH